MVGKKFKDLILGELANELIEELKKPVLKEGAGAVREKRRNADNGNKRVISVIFKNNL